MQRHRGGPSDHGSIITASYVSAGLTGLTGDTGIAGQTGAVCLPQVPHSMRNFLYKDLMHGRIVTRTHP